MDATDKYVTNIVIFGLMVVFCCKQVRSFYNNVTDGTDKMHYKHNSISVASGLKLHL